jgi:hypothetical protein
MKKHRRSPSEKLAERTAHLKRIAHWLEKQQAGVQPESWVERMGHLLDASAALVEVSRLHKRATRKPKPDR